MTPAPCGQSPRSFHGKPVRNLLDPQLARALRSGIGLPIGGSGAGPLRDAFELACRDALVYEEREGDCGIVPVGDRETACAGARRLHALVYTAAPSPCIAADSGVRARTEGSFVLAHRMLRRAGGRRVAGGRGHRHARSSARLPLRGAFAATAEEKAGQHTQQGRARAQGDCWLDGVSCGQRAVRALRRAPCETRRRCGRSSARLSCR